jgi:hypothetical protein
MATIGKSRAVVEIGRLHFGGLPAWFAWLALHVTVLIGFRNRVSVLMSWIYSYIFFRRGSRLITGLSSAHIAELSSDAIGGATQAPIGAVKPSVAGSHRAASLSNAEDSLPPRR